MVYGHDGAGWSQTGQFYATNHGCQSHFSQQEENVSYFLPVTVFGSCVTPGQVHAVWQQCLPSNGHVRANIDLSNFSETQYRVFSQEGSGSGSGWAQPFEVEVEGETKYPQSDVPGTSSLRSDFTTLDVQRYSDDAFETACNSNAVFFDDTTLARYSQYPPGCDHVQVWTNNPGGP